MKIVPRHIAVTALLVALTGCRNNTVQGSTMELKVYSVPPAQTEDLTRALNGSLITTKAHASVAMPGKILVYAPHETQASVGAAIDDLAKSTPAPPATQTPLRVSFWMIDAHPGPGPDDPALAPMSDLLDGLRVAMGAQHFNLTENVSGISSEAMSQIRTGGGQDFQFRTVQTGHDIQFALNYQDLSGQHPGHADIGSIQTQMTAKLGQYEVLARTMTTATDGTRPADSAPHPLRLLVARVDAANPAK